MLSTSSKSKCSNSVFAWWWTNIAMVHLHCFALISSRPLSLSLFVVQNSRNWMNFKKSSFILFYFKNYKKFRLCGSYVGCQSKNSTFPAAVHAEKKYYQDDVVGEGLDAFERTLSCDFCENGKKWRIFHPCHAQIIHCHCARKGKKKSKATSRGMNKTISHFPFSLNSIDLYFSTQSASNHFPELLI